MAILKRFALLAALALFGSIAHATTFASPTCNESDWASTIATAVAAGSGNTVTIPSCAGTVWTTALQVTLTVSLNVIAAGSQTITGGNDVTNIIDNVNHGVGGNPDCTMCITTSGTGVALRMSGFTLKSNGSSVTSNDGPFNIGGNSQSVRVDHIHLAFLQQALCTISGQLYGVADHNLFDQANLGCKSEATGWNAASSGTGDQQGDGSWNDVSNFGTNKAFYFENNIFNSTSPGTPQTSNDCTGGGRFIYRFNAINIGGALQTHPTGHAGDDRGCRAWEIYDNTFTGNSLDCPGGGGTTCEFNVMFASSGTGLIWGNSAAAGYEHFLTLVNLRTAGNSSCGGTATYCQVSPPNGWGYCSNVFTGTGSLWDQTQGSTGYACLDQPGRGVGDLLSGLFPTKCDQTLGCTTFNGQWPNEASEPIYEFADLWNSVAGFPSTFLNNENPSQIVANQDVYVYTLAWNGTAFAGTAFNGTVGTGSGVLASRPATCTTGVGYWATDQGTWNTTATAGPVSAQIGTQGVLYKCTSTNTWTLSYTPFTYPHPLVTGSTPVTPAPPTTIMVWNGTFTKTVPVTLTGTDAISIPGTGFTLTGSKPISLTGSVTASEAVSCTCTITNGKCPISCTAK